MTKNELRKEFARHSVCGEPSPEVTAQNPSTVQEYCLWLEELELKRRNRYVMVEENLSGRTLNSK